MKPILMTASNPDGYKLEDLLAQIQVELLAKTQNIIHLNTPVALEVKANNYKILGCLVEAESAQRNSYKRLETIGTDQGPLGQPRLS